MSGTVADNINRQSGVIAEPAGGPEVRSDDPSASEGTVWFNTTSGVLKVYRDIAAWSTGGNLSATRINIHGNNGTQSACFIACGSTPGGDTATTEEYDGSSWSSGGNATAAKNSAISCGTLTAGLLAAGGVTTTEEYNGTGWTTSGGTVAHGVFAGGGTGTQTAGLMVAGFTEPPSVKYATAEEYDGTSWADGGDLATAQYGTTSVGTLTAALTAGGNSGSRLNTAYEYNGTSWTSVTAQSEAKDKSLGFGIQTDGVICGGDTGSKVTTVQIWSGTAWSTGSSMPAAKASSGAGGTSSIGLVTGGYDADNAATATTFELGLAVTARTVTDS